VTVLQ